MHHIEGRQPVREALRAGKRPIQEIVVAEGAKGNDLQDILKRAGARGIHIQRTSREQLEHMTRTSAHQGIIARCDPYPYVSLEELWGSVQDRREPSLFLIAAHIKDPHNLGALIRSAEAAGVSGVIIPRRRAAGVTPTVVKASAGATEHVDVVVVTNLVRAVRWLKERRVWVFGGDPAGECMYDVNLSGNVALCVGSEGRGLPRLLRQTCDELIRIPLLGAIDSLNVSVAGGIMLYEVVRRRRSE